MMKRCVSYCVCLSTFCSVLIIFVKEGFIPEPEPRSSTDNPSIPPGNGVPQPSNEMIWRQQIRHFQGEASKSKKREKKMVSYYWSVGERNTKCWLRVRNEARKWRTPRQGAAGCAQERAQLHAAVRTLEYSGVRVVRTIFISHF